VWKCEAPGGLHKAIKFVPDDPDRPAGAASGLQQEFDAFQRIKAIRHPFLLTLERVELVKGELVMVMELADRQLADRFAECQAAGMFGVPRVELLGYLADAAEVLDLFTGKHDLQHLDVKPANLFLVCGRVKVGDFGLVGRLQATGTPASLSRGITPKYSAPEVLRGQVDPRSDQYSLALVYQELLTGNFPYPAKSVQQMLMQHAAGTPDLSALPAADRAAVGKALSKKPEDRFATCLEFVRALTTASLDQALSDTHRLFGPATMPLVADEPAEPPEEAVRFGPAVRVVRTGPPSGRYTVKTGADLVAAVRKAAGLADDPVPTPQRIPGRDVWRCRFPFQRQAGVAEFRLAVFRDRWGMELDHPDDRTFVVRKCQHRGVWGSLTGQRAGVELVVRVPAVGDLAEPAVVTGYLVGSPDDAFRQAATTHLPRLVDDVRRELQAASERRREVRVPADLPVAVHPVKVGGGVLPAIPGRCRDVSVGGVCFTVEAMLPSRDLYLTFGGAADGYAIPSRLVRMASDPGSGVVAAAQFRPVG
jgi:hypothetical protein